MLHAWTSGRAIVYIGNVYVHCNSELTTPIDIPCPSTLKLSAIQSLVSRSLSAITSSMTFEFKPGHFDLPHTNHETTAKIQINALIGRAYW